MTDLARNELFNDKLTEFVRRYDGRKKEPVTLPSKLPMLLMLGAEGIAVGLSTRILPHNFIELLDAEIAVLQKKKFTLFPDFQQGGIMDTAEYDLGRWEGESFATLARDRGVPLQEIQQAALAAYRTSRSKRRGTS